MKSAKSTKKNLFVVLLGVLALCAGLLSVAMITGGGVDDQTTVYAATTSTGNLWRGKKFDGYELDKLATNAGYTGGINALLAGVAGGDIKDYNDFTGGKINLGSYTFGGTSHELTWVPSYLSKDDDGNVILTLLLSAPGAFNTQGVVSDQEWTPWSDGTYKYEPGAANRQTFGGSSVYANTYDGSYLRNAILNGGSTYTNSWGYYWNGSSAVAVSGTRVTLSPNRTKFTILTSGALSSYIVSPEKVSWQKSQKAMNDLGYDVTTGDYQKAYYPTSWGNDKIWIPSYAEARAGGLWGFPQTATMHTRTATTNYSSEVLQILNNAQALTAVSDIYAVRPAFHLNLTAAAANCERVLASPENVRVTYGGRNDDLTPQTMDNIAKPDWYDPTKMTVTPSTGMLDAKTYTLTATLKRNDPTECWDDGTFDPKNFNFIIQKKDVEVVFTPKAGMAPDVGFASGSLVRGETNVPAITLTYQEKGTAGTSTTPPRNPGNYTATASIPNNCNYRLVSTTEHPVTFDFTVTRQKVKVPKLRTTSGRYTGSPIRFGLDDYVSSDVRLVLPSGVTESGDELLVTNAGSYEIKAQLIDTLKDWDIVGGGTAEQTVGTIKIDKVNVNFSLEYEDGSTDASGNPDKKCSQSDSPNMKITARTPNNEKVKMNVYAVDGGNKTLLSPNVTADNTDTIFAPNITGLVPGNTYNIVAEPTGDTDESNGNFNLSSVTTVTLTVTEPTSEVSVTWRLTHGSTRDSMNVGKKQTAVYAPSTPLTYDGNVFHWTVNTTVLALSGYKIDTTFGTNGYEHDRETDAGVYTTSVRIVSTAAGVGYSEIFEINWKVEQAKYDLSNVKWKGDGTLEYNGLVQSMELENLPSGLSPDIGGVSRSRDVTASPLTATVDDFILSDTKNYVKPDQSDPDSYIGPFDWSVAWNIVPAKIKMQWGKAAVTDANGSIFNATVLRNEDAQSVVNYTYYRTDASGNKLDSIPMNVGNIIVPASGEEYYICEVSLVNNDGNYVLDGNPVSPVFAVRDMGTAVTFTPVTQTFAYTGSAINAQFKNNAGIKKNGYTVKYMDESGNALPSAPVGVGKYRVGVTLNPELDGTYFIAGANEWEIEIVARVIPVNWNMSAKPPRLNIYKQDAALIEYDIIDENGSPVAFRALAAGKYQIRARIKTEYLGSATFAGGGTETDWVDFELTDADLPNLVDPSDPGNYLDDPNDPNKEIPDPDDPIDDPTDDPTDETDGNLPLWQFCVGGISILLTVVFLAKGFGNRRAKKDAERQIDKLERKKDGVAYAAMGLLLGMEEGFWGITGLWWTVIAASLAAVCLLSLAFMAITGKGKKKALAALEEAEEEAEDAQRAAWESRKLEDADKEKQRAEEERARREEERLEREEQRRLDEQRREEERQRHEEEMKMLVMMMNNGGTGNARGGSGPMNTIDTTAEELVSRVVTALIPMLQQSLPAGNGNALLEQQNALIAKQDAIIEELRRDRDEQREMLVELLHRGEPNYAAEPVYTGTEAEEDMPQTVIHFHGGATESGNGEAFEKLRREQAEQKELLEKLLRATEDKNLSEPQAVVVDNTNDEALEAMRREQEELRKKQEEQNALLAELLRATKAQAEKSAEPAPEPQVVYVTPEPTEEPAIERPEIVRLTYAEAYAALEDEKKTLLNDLRDYAVVKSGSTSSEAKYHMTVGAGAKQVLKVVIKDGVPIAGFRVEDARLRELRRASGRTEVKIKETQVSIDTHEALEMAKNLVDLRTVQIEEDIERRKEEQKQKRKEKSKK